MNRLPDKKYSKSKPISLIFGVDILILVVFLTIVGVGFQKTILSPEPPPTTTPDNRPKISGCLSWNYLNASDYIKTLCVYGYPSPPIWEVVGEIGPYYQIEFYTNQNWLNINPSYNWRSEGRPYIVHLFIDNTVESDRTKYLSSKYPELVWNGIRCVAITGEVVPISGMRGDIEIPGFLIKVETPAAVRELNNCD